MLKDLIREHARLAAEVQILESKINAERTVALAMLPQQFGYPDLASFISALKGAVKPGPRRGTRKKPSTATPAETAHPPSLDFPGQSAALRREAAPAPQLPTGTSLDDPANFGAMPDYAVFERGSLSLEAYVEALTKALRHAETVLHTSKVPAAVWREWRQFERKIAPAIQAAKDAERPSSAHD